MDSPDSKRELKIRVRAARTKALRTVNTQLNELYWSIGKTILERHAIDGWGSGVIGRLAGDLGAEFPDMTGPSRSICTTCAASRRPGRRSIQMSHSLGHLPWGHIRTILDKRLEPAAREWYAAAAVEHGWSPSVLMNMIMNKTLERTGAAPSNFVQNLVAPDSELAARAVSGCR